MYNTEQWIDILHEENPYENFDPKDLKLDMQGWGSNEPIFSRLIEEIKPKLIIEIGTWKGASAIHMAGYLSEDSSVICIDSWLEEDVGYSTEKEYNQFLYNVKRMDLENVIVPYPKTSLEALSMLKHYEVKADLIYIDAGHTYNEVMQDMKDCWKILKVGGVMFGDDYVHSYWKEIPTAVADFCKNNNVESIIESRFWQIEKK